MSFEQEIKNYLIEKPLAREQRYVNQATWGFLSKKYHFETLDRDLFYKIGTKFDSVRRLIAKIQEEEESLRGSDWNLRRVREQKAQISLGYEGGYGELSKLSNKL